MLFRSRRVLSRGVARSRSGEARQRVVIPTLGVGVLSASFLALALAGIIADFRSLRAFFYRSIRISIRRSSESNNRHRAASL